MSRASRSRLLGVGVGAVALLTGAAAPALAQASAVAPAMVNGPVHYMAPFHGTKGGHGGHGPGGGGGGSTSNQLVYNGGTVQGMKGYTQEIYIVHWGSQWGSGSTINNDPSGEVPLQDNFLSELNSGWGDTWSKTVTQYCDGIGSGSTSCGSSPTIQEPSSSVIAGTWWDNSSAAPSNARQNQIAAEAVAAAVHFASRNIDNPYSPNAQFIIDFPPGVDPQGFGHQYCAWHSSVTTSSGTISYTNFPYITDAGASCGANFNGLGADAGITIVGGHEYAEAVTDPQPSSGWLNGSGSEIGDLCAWSSQSADIALTNATTSTTKNYAVQPLWSNAANGGAGGCVMSYP